MLSAAHIFVLVLKVGALGEAKRQVIVILIARSFANSRRIRRRRQGENRPAIKPKYQTLRVYYIVSSKMKLQTGVILDRASLDVGDLDLSGLNHPISHWQSYDHSSASETYHRVKNSQVVISNKVVIDASLLSQLSQLRLICVAATGTNNVDLVVAEKHHIAVCNVTGYATPSVVQHVFALIFALHTHLCEYRQLVKQNEWQKSKHFCLLNYPIAELAGKTLGIIGYGELGKAVASAAQAFGLQVLIAQSLTGPASADRVSLDRLLSSADIVSLHCPLTDQTHNLINAAMLAKMKTTSILINTARGGIVNEQDLLDALLNKQIAAAGLDVLSEEPPRNNVLLRHPLPNLMITPHIAWASQASRQRLINEVGKNIEAFYQGERRNRVV